MAKVRPGRLGVAVLLVVGAAIARPPTATAEPDASHESVAMLPLDAEARLELYSQPVATELARPLLKDKIDVVVIGSKMAMPATARLVVDGTITSKGDLIVLAVRIRNPADGKVLDTLSASAHGGVENLDRAASELSARLLPAVRAQLVALATPAVKPDVRVPDTHRAIVQPEVSSLLVSFSHEAGAGREVEPLRAALAEAVVGWGKRHGHEAHTVEPDTLAANVATRTIAASHSDVAVSFEVIAYSVEQVAHDDLPGSIPVARARVHVRIVSPTAVELDRVVATDSIVGDRQMTPAALVSRVADEVLAILRPHLRRTVPTWH